MKKLIFKGAGVAIVTPFTEDGINFPEFGRMIDAQIAGHTDAIIVAGTTGEAATMSDAEHKEAIKFARFQRYGLRDPALAIRGKSGRGRAALGDAVLQ